MSEPIQALSSGVFRGAASLVYMILVISLILGIAPNIDTRLVQVGEWIWPGYAAELRVNPMPPDCDLEELKQRAASCPTDGSEPPKTEEEGDPFGGEDPFAEPSDKDPFGGEDPFAAPKPAEIDPFGGEDPFTDGEATPSATDKTPDLVDPFGGEDPFAEPANDPDDPFGGADPFAEPSPQAARTGAEIPPKPASDPFAGQDPFADPTEETLSSADCRSLQSLTERCTLRHETYTSIVSRSTTATRLYRYLELTVSDLARFPYWKHLLVLLILLGALNATLQKMHIALRRPKNQVEYVLSQGSQLSAHVLLFLSCVADWQVQVLSDAEREAPLLTLLWAAGFGALCLVNFRFLSLTPYQPNDKPVSIPRLLMVVPLYAALAIGSGLYFLLVEGHPSGQAIYLHKFAQHPTIYLCIGLYIWSGMLFSITRTAHLTFDVLRPWNIPPPLLAWLVVVGSAIPTAYSGASGIFVLAAGAVIFTELRRAGASPRLSLAATAMSGSLGVVLRPCLVVVLIAALNNQVTTDELFTAGAWVFALTAALFLIAIWLRYRPPLRLHPEKDARHLSRKALMKLGPFAGISVGVIGVYALIFDTWLNERSAAYILPVVLIFVVWQDRRSSKNRQRRRRIIRALVYATGESSTHIGALLMLMSASVCLGGVVERADVMSALPTSLGSPTVTMAALVVVMVIVGMTMDALGAVVLISVTMADLAIDSGIDPVHFWMMVLVAFELGYLTPPVSLNHLLARQVIGEEAEVENQPVSGNLLIQYEHLLLPMGVMGIALLLVAFVPLWWT